MTTRWKLRQDMRIARRSDGLVVVHQDDRFWLLEGGHVMPLTGGSLEQCVDQADELRPPPGWTKTREGWQHESWSLVCLEHEWHVRTRTGAHVPVRPHGSAHRARAWCELRVDRAGLNLRGPLPKR